MARPVVSPHVADVADDDERLAQIRLRCLGRDDDKVGARKRLEQRDLPAPWQVDADMVEFAGGFAVAEEGAEFFGSMAATVSPSMGALRDHRSSGAVLVEIDQQDAGAVEGERGSYGGAGRGFSDTAFGGRKRENHTRPQILI